MEQWSSHAAKLLLVHHWFRMVADLALHMRLYNLVSELLNLELLEALYHLQLLVTLFFIPFTLR